MTRPAATLLQILLALFGLGVLAFLLWEPNVEGRNAHATLLQVYFHDPFLAVAYAVSLAFFTALYQAFRLAGEAGRGGLAAASARRFRIMQICAAILLAAIAVADMCLFLHRAEDDIAGGVFMGLLVVLAAAAMLGAAVLGERALRRRAA
jgi:hypothetical protein